MNEQNGFNQQFNNDLNNNNTPETPNKNSAIVGGIFALLLLIGIVVIILNATGKIDLNKASSDDTTEEKANKEESKPVIRPTEEQKTEVNEEPEEPKKENSEVTNKPNVDLAALCDKRGEYGEYNEDVVLEFFEAMEADDSAESLKNVRGKEFCIFENCYYFPNDSTKEASVYNCETKEYTDFKWDPIQMRANITLSSACANVNSQGNFVADDINCQNFVCKVTIDGKEFSSECKY